MSAVLFRTSSGSINSSLSAGSPRFTNSLRRHDTFSGGEKLEFSPSLHLEVKNNHRKISRAISEPKVITRFTSSISVGSQTFPEMLPEVDDDSLPVNKHAVGSLGSLKFMERCFDQTCRIPASGFAVKESQISGVGSGSGRDSDGFGSGSRYSGGSNNNDNQQSKIGAYYQKLLKSNPNDPLLLRNYGKFLHEVQGDSIKAEECYGRAILASPGDGELLSLYGKLIWDTQRDSERAKSYFDQAVCASPDDCMVMGSYAQFMWETEEDEDGNNEEEESIRKVSIQPMIGAF